MPRKVLLALPSGRSVIGEVLTRCNRIAGMDEVVCAIPYDDHELAEEAEKFCRVVRGPEDDVLTRYLMASQGFDHIMRITGDCPLICPELCREVLALHLHEGADYTSNVHPRTFPKGLDCEVFKRGALEIADWMARPEDREHVTSRMLFDIAGRRLIGANLPNLWPMDGRLCLDTEDDYKVICKALEPCS